LQAVIEPVLVADHKHHSATGGHIPVLDGLRAVAILLVICFHFQQGRPPSLVGKIAVGGQTGVDLFFVLSGFLITGILLDSKGSPHFLRNFYARRILRIFPLYYGALIAYYIVGPYLHLNAWTPWRKGIWFWFFLQNVFIMSPSGTVSGPGHFWSLAVEEHFYLVWPFVVMLAPRDRLLRVAGFAIGLSLLTRVILINYGTFYFTLARLDGLAMGAALAIFARRQGGSLARLVTPATILLGTLGPALILTQFFVSGQGLTVIQILKSTLVDLAYACVMILVLEKRLGWNLHRLLSGRILGSIGKYSYGMYVFHLAILFELGRAGIPYNPLGVAAAIFVTWAIAWLSWNLFEKRFLRMKRFFEYRPEETAAPFQSLTAVRS
jgi:peptidoglycan/LPS O-acetylase OafA/YrhL